MTEELPTLETLLAKVAGVGEEKEIIAEVVPPLPTPHVRQARTIPTKWERLVPGKDGRLTLEPLPLRRLLVAQGQAERNANFSIEGSSLECLRFVTRFAEAYNALISEPAGWDMVIYSGYLGDYAKWTELCSPLIMAFNRGQVRSVLLTNSIKREGMQALKLLQDGGVPAAYSPHYSNSPRHHPVLRFNETEAK